MTRFQAFDKLFRLPINRQDECCDNATFVIYLSEYGSI